MKLTITAEASHPIHAEGMSPTEQVAMLLAAIGYGRAMPAQDTAAFVVPAPSVSSVSSDAAPDAPAASVLDEPSVQAIAKRERGKPSPGKKRRTAEEVAEDEEAEQCSDETLTIASMTTLPDNSTPQQVAEAFANLRGHTAEAAEAKAGEQAISTGEDRVGPEDETEEDQIQDIADEHAEVAANTPADAPITLETVRAALGDYVTAYGMPAVQVDGQLILKDVLGPVPEGMLDPQGRQATAWAVSKFPEEKYPQIVAAFKAAIESNPYGRARV